MPMNAGFAAYLKNKKAGVKTAPKKGKVVSKKPMAKTAMPAPRSGGMMMGMLNAQKQLAGKAC